MAGGIIMGGLILRARHARDEVRCRLYGKYHRHCPSLSVYPVTYCRGYRIRVCRLQGAHYDTPDGQPLSRFEPLCTAPYPLNALEHNNNLPILPAHRQQRVPQPRIGIGAHSVIRPAAERASALYDKKDASFVDLPPPIDPYAASDPPYNCTICAQREADTQTQGRIIRRICTVSGVGRRSTWETLCSSALNRGQRT